ncbi:SRPBCC family protein (plasmid) [Paracoccus marcusii]|uniref:SRPBCC family protein n=1 Tax=Paracoccus TaxID=265 RepID=UPI0018917F79|nr:MULTISPECIES: SRPBCC family protein [Paracoccus]MBF5080049.1 SRPBCC family protein [Paracoccus sp. NBH48]QXI65834.1 hypothetical protein CP157_03626 [Paracoccus marcusii]
MESDPNPDAAADRRRGLDDSRRGEEAAHGPTGTVPRASGIHQRGRTLSPLAEVAIGVGAAALVAFAGKALMQRQTSSRPADDADPRFHNNGDWHGKHAVVGKTMLINRSPAEVYAYWRNLSNHSQFMDNVRSVRDNGSHSIWTLTNALGREVEIEVRLSEERENERLAWACVPGAPIEMQGAVKFREAPAGRGTYVDFDMEYVPPAGAAGRAFANLVRRAPQQQARHGLKRLRMIMEAGEVATSARYKEEA